MIDDHSVFVESGNCPARERGFFHKKVLGLISKVTSALPLPGAGVVSTITRHLAGGGPAPSPASRPPWPGLQWPPLAFGGGGGGGAVGPNGCPPGTRRSPRGNCISPISPRGAEVFHGEAVMGRFGPAQVPGSQLRDVAICPTGMALGKDGLCYDHLPNRDRKYPRGRRPLLTGGDMRSISVARRAGNRLANAKTDLIAIGMLKSSTPRRRKKKAVPCA